MKRFWTKVDVVESGAGRGIALDGRPLKTPARATLVLPTPSLADAVAQEWRECGEEIDPRRMPMTGLANAAIDRVAPDPAAFAAQLARYAEADLLCYRAEGPSSLVERQAAAWDPPLEWARRRFDVTFVVTHGLMHVDQPRATVDRLSRSLQAQDPFRLAALSPLITIGGALVTALALLEQALTIDQLVAAVTLDEQWQIDKWGADAEAEAVLAARAADLRSAARFLDLLRG